MTARYSSRTPLGELPRKWEQQHEVHNLGPVGVGNLSGRPGVDEGARGHVQVLLCLLFENLQRLGVGNVAHRRLRLYRRDHSASHDTGLWMPVEAYALQ